MPIFIYKDIEHIVVTTQDGVAITPVIQQTSEKKEAEKRKSYFD